MKLSYICCENVKGGIIIVFLYSLWLVAIACLFSLGSLSEIVRMVLVIVVTFFCSPLIAMCVLLKFGNKTTVSPLSSKVQAASSVSPLFVSKFDFALDVFRKPR